MKLLYPHKDLGPLKIKWKIKEGPQRFFSKSRPRPEGTEHFLLSVVQSILHCFLPIKCLVNTNSGKEDHLGWGTWFFKLQKIAKFCILHTSCISHCTSSVCISEQLEGINQLESFVCWPHFRLSFLGAFIWTARKSLNVEMQQNGTYTRNTKENLCENATGIIRDVIHQWGRTFPDFTSQFSFHCSVGYWANKALEHLDNKQKDTEHEKLLWQFAAWS